MKQTTPAWTKKGNDHYELLDDVRGKSHVLDTAIGNMEHRSRNTSALPTIRGRPGSSPDDFLMLAMCLTRRCWVRRSALELTSSPFPLLTRHHHGVDFFPPSVQGYLLFWRHEENGISTKYLPYAPLGSFLSFSSYAPESLSLLPAAADFSESPFFQNPSRTKWCAAYRVHGSAGKAYDLQTQYGIQRYTGKRRHRQALEKY
jgi:hypothetical protein